MSGNHFDANKTFSFHQEFLASHLRGLTFHGVLNYPVDVD